MPVNPAIVGAGIGLAGQLINAGSTRKNNQSQQNHALAMQRLQNAQNVNFWNMQNEYNSPSAQMQRLKDAGLNPNLVYGASAPGNSAGQVHAASPQAWQPKAPQFELGSVMDTYFNIAMQSAQLDNVKAINNKIQAETQAIVSQGAIKGAEANYAEKYFRERSEIQQFNRDDKYLDLQVKGQGQEARMAQEEERIQNVFQQQRLDLKIKNAIDTGKSLDNVLKQLDVDLKKNGINPNDPVVMRVIGRLVSQFFNLSTFKFK